MKDLPIDTSRMKLLCAVAPAAVADSKSKRPRADESGPLYMVKLVVLYDSGAEIMPIRLSASPSSRLIPGTPVRVAGLVATQWVMGNRCGVSFRADRTDPEGSAEPGA